MLARTASAMTAAAAQVWPEPAAAPDKGTARALFLHQARGVFEGFVLLVALVAVERIFLGRGTYAGLDVHPFWLPVLLVTMQYGLYGGVITACLASLMLDWPIRPPGQDIVDFYFELVRLPVQWVLVAMAIGIFRQAQIRADAVRERTLAHLRSVNDLFAQEVARLDDENRRFGRRQIAPEGFAAIILVEDEVHSFATHGNQARPQNSNDGALDSNFVPVSG